MLENQQKSKILRKFIDWCLQYYVLLDEEDITIDLQNFQKSEEDIIIALRLNSVFDLLEVPFVPVDWEDFLLGFELFDLTSENLLFTKNFIDNFYYHQKTYIRYLFLSVFDQIPDFNQ